MVFFVLLIIFQRFLFDLFCEMLCFIVDSSSSRWCVYFVCVFVQTKGWSKEAQVEFRSVVGSAAVEMRPLGQDRDSLLVDLKKAPMDQSSDVPISVREYLVFIEVARYTRANYQEQFC